MKKLLVLVFLLLMAVAVTAQADVSYEDAIAEVPATFQEAPMLAEKVESGELPPVEERLPSEPLVIEPYESIGEYGGTLYEYAPSVNGFDDLHWTRRNNWLQTANSFHNYDGDQEFVPYRIKSIVANEDQTEYTIHMREGIKWSDGVDCTIDDLIWTFEHVWNNDELNTGISVWKDNRPTWERIDDYTMKLIFAQPCGDFVSTAASNYTDMGVSWGFMEIPAHYAEQYHIDFNPDVNDIALEAGYESWTDYFWDMIGSGGNDQASMDVPTLNAWVMVEKTTTQVVWERNPYFFAVDTAGNQLPYIDRIVVEAVSDTEIAKLKLMAGEFDMQGVFLAELSDYPMLLQNQESGNYTITLAGGTSTAKPMIAFNLLHEDPDYRALFQNPEFSKAMSIAIDRDEINDMIFQGLGEGMQDVYIYSDYVDSSEWRYAYTEYDPDKAGEMLDALGMTIGADGYRTLPNGEQFVIKLDCIAEEGFASALEIVAEQWSKIGINVQYNVIDRTLFHSRVEANDFDVWTWGDANATEQACQTSASQWNLNEKAWGWYYTLTGTENTLAEEVPEEWAQYWSDMEALKAAEYGSDEYVELVNKVWNFRIDKLYVIGTVGAFPNLLITQNGLENVGNVETPFNYWRSQMPEQFYWSDAARRAD